MREIKLRLWNGGAMEPAGSITFHTDGSYHVNDEYPVNDKTMDEQFGGNKYHLMQFTGIHDKSGNEIYEGDIVRGVHYNDVAAKPVIWWGSGWYTGYDNGEQRDVTSLSAVKDPEVIGNIYERPELN